MMSLSGINPASLIIFLAKSMILTTAHIKYVDPPLYPSLLLLNQLAGFRNGHEISYNIRMRNRYGAAISYLFAKQRAPQNHWTQNITETGSNEFCGFYAILF
jgi:hypothetical protein